MQVERVANLGALFAPVSASEFFARFWQRRPLLSRGAPPERFAGIVGLADVDELVSTVTSLDDGWLMLTKDGVPRPSSTVRGRDKLVDLAAVYAAYDDGVTLLLTMLQQRWPAIRALCRALERELMGQGVLLARRIAANLYLTPAGARGFDPHYDDHDVLVLHLEGEKRWRIYGPHEPRPIRPQVRRTEQLPPLEAEETLRPGQALYLPRGVYHEAVAGAGPSLHLTLGITPLTWIDLVSRMLPSVAAAREALPLVGAGPGGADALRGPYEDLMRSLLERGDAVRAAQQLADEALEALGPLPDDGFGQRSRLGALALDSRVRHRRGAVVRLRGEEGRRSLRFPGGGVRGPEELAPLLDFIADHASFRVGDLPDAVTADSKLELVRQLIREGLLCADPEEPGPR